MPQPIPPGMRLGLVKPQDAAGAFARRDLLQPSFRWQDVFQAEHARAFAVAGVMRLDILALFRAEIERAVTEGKGLEAFRNAIRPQLVAKGWWGDIELTDPATGETRVGRFNERRLRLIYDVNLRQSHAAGRWASIERLKERFPFVTYRTMRDERVRAGHAEWDGVTLPVDHPFWKTHYPPNGWACRCSAFAVDEEGIAALRKAGVKVKLQAPEAKFTVFTSKSTAAVYRVPAGIDPGFAYNPGQARDAAFFDAALAKATSARREGSVAITQALLDDPELLAAKTRSFGDWAKHVITANRPNGQLENLGVLHPWMYDALVSWGIELRSSVIAVTDRDVIHAMRQSKEDRLPIELYGKLPKLLVDASAILLDVSQKEPALLFVVKVPGDGDGTANADGAPVAKLVLRLDYDARVSGLKQQLPINILRSAKMMGPTALLGYRLIWGKL